MPCTIPDCFSCTLLILTVPLLYAVAYERAAASGTVSPQYSDLHVFVADMAVSRKTVIH